MIIKKTAQAILSLNETEIVQAFDWQLHMIYTKAYLPCHTSTLAIKKETHATIAHNSSQRQLLKNSTKNRHKFCICVLV